MQRHAAVMGNTWGMLIPLTILMARLRNKKGWWFQLHRALAVASLFWVVVGVILGLRLRITHPPVTTAGKLHKFFGYTALTFICLQVAIPSGSFAVCILHLLMSVPVASCPMWGSSSKLSAMTSYAHDCSESLTAPSARQSVQHLLSIIFALWCRSWRQGAANFFSPEFACHVALLLSIQSYCKR